MTKSPFRVFAAGIFGVLILAAAATVLAADTAPRITKEDAKGMLGNPEVIFVDVRQTRDWDSSKSKIKGAVREDAENVNVWMGKYPKEKTLILYGS